MSAGVVGFLVVAGVLLAACAWGFWPLAPLPAGSDALRAPESDDRPADPTGDPGPDPRQEFPALRWCQECEERGAPPCCVGCLW